MINGSKILYISGKITYQTGFGVSDTLPFCFTYNSINPQFDSCPTVNYADMQRFDKADKALENNK